MDMKEMQTSLPFRRLEKAALPTYIITSPNVTSSIRFFDSTPFSVSNRLLAYIQIPLEAERMVSHDSFRYPAAVVVTNLLTGVTQHVATTRAWGRYIRKANHSVI